MLCDRGWHVRCRPPDARLVSKKFLVCPRHSEEGQQPEQRQEQQQAQQQAQPGLRLQPPAVVPDRVLSLSVPPPQQGLEDSATQPGQQQEPEAPPPAKRRRQCPALSEVQQQPATPVAVPASRLAAEPLQQKQAEEDAEDGELPSEVPAARPALQQAAAADETASGLAASDGRQLQTAGSIGGATVMQAAELLRSPSSRSSQSAVALYLRPSPQARPQQPQQQQGEASPFAACKLHLPPAQHQPPDLDAQRQPLSPTGQQPEIPLSPRLSLQPSWQASLASRAVLDYGEL